MNDPFSVDATWAANEAPSAEGGTQSIKIRRATIADLEIIVNIWCEGVQSSFGRAAPQPDSVVEFFRQHIETETEPFGYWIAEVHGKVAGWQSLLRTRPNPFSRWAHSSTYVSSDHKGKGIGRCLLAFASAHARGSEISYIEGFVLANNLATTRIVESLGWQSLGIVPGEDPEEVLWVYAADRD